jgi:hypothetical protein
MPARYQEPTVTTPPTKVDALEVECPSCGAAVGERCWSGTRRGRHLTRGHHAGRRRVAAGERVPESFATFIRREIRRVQGDVLSKRKP